MSWSERKIKNRADKVKIACDKKYKALEDAEPNDITYYINEINVGLEVAEDSINLLKDVIANVENREYAYNNLSLNSIYIDMGISDSFDALIDLSELINSDNNGKEKDIEGYINLRDRIIEKFMKLKDVDEYTYNKLYSELMSSKRGKLIKHIMGDYRLDKKREKLGLPKSDKTIIQKYPHSYGVYHSNKSKSDKIPRTEAGDYDYPL